MALNVNLYKAKNEKNDEFYTKFDDVEEELKHYEHHFAGKIVFCNCDDPTKSAFWQYFHMNFEKLGLKKLISTHYDKEASTYKMEYEGGNDMDINAGVKTLLEGNGDFRSEECLSLLDQCDIVVSNPPFSLARSFINILIKYHKKFVIIGDLNWVCYKELFPLIKNNEVWFGYNHIKEFVQPDGSIKKFGNKLWYTNLDIAKRHEELQLLKKYVPGEYHTYDNYNAINVDKVTDIPYDYDGVMGVPITFLDQYNPNQFTIITLGSSPDLFTATKKYTDLLRYNTDGTTTKKHIACNQCLTIGYDEKPAGIYCRASNSDKYLVIPYKRILIRKRSKD